MVPNVPPASIVLGFSPRGGWIGTRINRHGGREEVSLLSIELVASYPSLLLFIARFVVMCTTVWEEGRRERMREREKRREEKRTATH